MYDKSEPYRGILCYGLPRKTGRQCDRVSSVFTSHSGNALASADTQTLRPCPACIPITAAIPDPTLPTIAMTYYAQILCCSAFAPVHSGVPQGSVLGAMLFTMYIKPLSAIIDSHSIIHHSFADDLQLQMSAPPDRISELLHSMQSCISDVKAWATVNMLRLNDSKTELMLVTSKRSKHLHNLPTSITIGNAQIPFKQSVKNLGFTLDCHLTMNAHVSNIARTCYFELRRLASIRSFLKSTATATLVSAFVLSRIDYCNSVWFYS